MTRLRQILDAISMLPDTEHHAEGRAAVLEELGCDVEWKRLNCSRVVLRGFAPDGRDPYEDGDDLGPVEERRNEARRRKRLDWLAWRDPLKITSGDAELRSAYPPGIVSGLAMQEHPLLRMLNCRGAEPDVLYMNPTAYRALAERVGPGHRRRRLARKLTEALSR